MKYLLHPPRDVLLHYFSSKSRRFIFSDFVGVYLDKQVPQLEDHLGTECRTPQSVSLQGHPLVFLDGVPPREQLIRNLTFHKRFDPHKAVDLYYQALEARSKRVLFVPDFCCGRGIAPR
jgi:hypothetical protein